MKKTSLLSLVSLFAFFRISSLSGQVVLTGASYNQDFNQTSTFQTTSVGNYAWVNNTTIPGWYGMTTNAATSLYRATNGNSFSPGASNQLSLVALRASGTDASLGVISNATYKGIFGVQFMNNTGATITSISVTYTGEQWAWNTGGFNALQFSYSLDAASLSTGTWTDYDALDFGALYSENIVNQGLDGKSDTILNGTSYVAKTVGQAGGPGALNQTTITATITGLSIAQGDSLWFRWSDDFSGSGTGQGLAIDNFKLTVIPEPSATVLLPISGAVALMLLRRHRLISKESVAAVQ